MRAIKKLLRVLGGTLIVLAFTLYFQAMYYENEANNAESKFYTLVSIFLNQEYVSREYSKLKIDILREQKHLVEQKRQKSLLYRWFGWHV